MADASGRVFLSHASEDKAAGMEICTLLEVRGVSCWIAPRDIAPGADWAAAIAEAIRTCRVMVILLTPAANQSEHMEREVQLADRSHVPVVPVRLQDCNPVGALAYFLSNRHYLDLFPGPIASHQEALLELVRTGGAGGSGGGGGGGRGVGGDTRRWPWVVAAGVAGLTALIAWLVIRPPVIEVIEAEPRRVEAGGNLRLDWRVSNAREVAVISDLAGDGQPGQAQVVGKAGQLSLTAAKNMIYSLRATSWTKSVEVLFPVRVVTPVQHPWSGNPPPPGNDVVRTAEAFESDGIPGYRLGAIEPQPQPSDFQWACNLEIDYTYDKRHHPVSVVGGEIAGDKVRTLRWDIAPSRGEETDEGAIKRGTRRVIIAVQVVGDEGNSRELRLFIAQGDPPGPIFYVRTFPFARRWSRP